MGDALSAGVTGLRAHQQMLEVAGNNLANVNTTAFKGSQIRFAELLSETVRKASAPSANSGGINPIQMGSGVGVSNVIRNMTSGGFIETGQALDMAIEGNGYFVLNDGSGDIFTRIGSFAIDADSMLVDPATGYRLQRIGTAGEADGFQVPGDTDIKIPYDAAMPAMSTSSFNLSSNLRAAGNNPTTNTLSSGTAYTLADGSFAATTTELQDLSQYSGAWNAADTIEIRGINAAGTAVSVDYVIPAATTTVGDLLTVINAAFSGSTASLDNGKLILSDDAAGYSKTDMTLDFVGGGTAALTTPGYFELVEVGANDTHLVGLEIFDSMGGKHALSATFVKTDVDNEWDLVMTKLDADVSSIVDRRIEGITFNASNGAFDGINDTASSFAFQLANDPSTTQTIAANMGTVGMFDGLTQFDTGSNVASTANASNPDGYPAGQLSAVAVSGGDIVGTFSNGIKKVIATVKMAVFQNPAGLESIASGYYVSSANSGEAVGTQSNGAGAGKIRGQSLEKSNVQIAEEFVTMIQAQNGFQANARTIKVANEVLRELTNLIR